MISTRTSPQNLLWRDLYKAALFEPDPQRLADHIRRAESAIVSRARELFNQQGDHIEEELALDDALYALQALRSCLMSRSNAAA